VASEYHGEGMHKREVDPLHFPLYVFDCTVTPTIAGMQFRAIQAEPEAGEQPGIVETVTHGMHTFCVQDITGTHLLAFLAICTCVLIGRAWSHTRTAHPQQTKGE
jgi:hypothetical protein